MSEIDYDILKARVERQIFRYALEQALRESENSREYPFEITFKTDYPDVEIYDKWEGKPPTEMKLNFGNVPAVYADGEGFTVLNEVLEPLLNIPYDSIIEFHDSSQKRSFHFAPLPYEPTPLGQKKVPTIHSPDTVLTAVLPKGVVDLAAVRAEREKTKQL